MIERIIDWSLNNRLLVLILAALLVGGGTWSMLALPIDAFPDTTPVQVQINTVAPALSPAEIEQQITFPVEQAISGLPDLMEVRSISKFGLSQVTVIFEDAVDIYFARQLVGERLQTAELPEGVPRPEMGPVATGLGEVFHYIVRGDESYTLEELTTLHDWVIKPRLRSVEGVAEVNTWGGMKKQYQVLVDPNRLIRHELTLDELVDALQKNNLNVGGGNLERAGEQYLVHGIGLTTNEEEIAEIVIKASGGVPIRVRDVATVEIGHEIRRGAATYGGQGEVVLGLAFMLMGENSRIVTERLRERMDVIRDSLPHGVTVETVYMRTELVDKVIHTVKENLFYGALLVIAVLFMFLGNVRAGLIVALAIPLSMMFAFSAMLQFGIAGSLMSLGAIDFGLIVDSSVIQIENGLRRLAGRDDKRSRFEVVRDAVLEVRRPTMFGELIIMIVFLPVLMLEGIEGRMFRPMALTFIFALAGSLILSLTLMPVLASWLLPRNPGHADNLLVRAARGCYRPVVRVAMRLRLLVVVLALALMGGGLWLARGLGSEFIPRLSEMSLAINTVRLSGVSLGESVRYGTLIERFILDRFPDEVRDIWSRTGTAEVATDPMGIELTDVYLMLRPRDQWTRAETQEELASMMAGEMEALPGMRVVFTQPIEMRVNEMIAGIRSDVGIKIFGDDLQELKSLATLVEAEVQSIPGAADVYTEQITGQPVLEVRVDREAVARHGVPAAHVLEAVEAIGGTVVGEVREDQRRFDLVLRLAEDYRRDPDALESIRIPTASGGRLPLTQLATIERVEGPATITREWQKRRIVVQCNVRGRDVGSFVEELRERIDDRIDFPPGAFVAYGGQFEHLERAQLRLMIVVPIALALILFLLYTSTRSWRDTLMIFTGAPFAMLGGVAALWLRDMPFTISAGIGFVAVSGVSMLNGLVMLSTIRQMQGEGSPLAEAIEQAALIRLRPILMTALVAGLGFLPMMLNTGVGAEVQRPLATVVVGGVISDNLLTLLVLPALIRICGPKDSGAGQGSPKLPSRTHG